MGYYVNKLLDEKDELEDIILDLLDGQHNWWDILANTGLSEARCKEISIKYDEIKSKK